MVIAMNNREMIEKWKSKEGAPVYKLSELPIELSSYEMYVFGYGIARKEILEDLNQLDEPIKVVVPKFVAEWLETCKENASLADCLQCQYFSASEDGDVYATEKVENWVFENDNDKLLANAWVNGYEVETEQFYYVCDPTTKQYLGVDKVSNEAFWLLSHNSGARTPLTEQEIKAIDERYWPFAVKVDGE